MSDSCLWRNGDENMNEQEIKKDIIAVSTYYFIDANQ